MVCSLNDQSLSSAHFEPVLHSLRHQKPEHRVQRVQDLQMWMLLINLLERLKMVSQLPHETYHEWHSSLVLAGRVSE